MARACSSISSKVIADPPYTDKAYRRRCGYCRGRSSVLIPHMVDRRKQEVLEERDVVVTPLSQTRGGMCHVHLGRLHPAKTLTEHRSARCLHAHETPNTTPKPASVV